MRGMRIDGSGGGAWHRDRETQTFGSQAWRAHYGVSSGAQRARHDMASRDRARHEVAEIEARQADADNLALDAALDLLALEYAAELALPTPRSNARVDHAVTVRVHHPAEGLSETSAAALLSHGFRWSPRRGGIWWAPRSPLACQVAASICRPEITPE